MRGTAQKRLLIAAGVCFVLSVAATVAMKIYHDGYTEPLGGVLLSMAVILVLGAWGANMLANGE